MKMWFLLNPLGEAAIHVEMPIILNGSIPPIAKFFANLNLQL